MLSSIAKPFAALALAAALISIVLAALGASPFGVFAALGEGAFGNWYACVDTIVKSTPLIFTGLAVVDRILGRALEYRRRRTAHDWRDRRRRNRDASR